jgi:glycolate oxidase FAD binding subunit
VTRLDQISSLTSDVANAPEADLVVSPRSIDDVVTVIRVAYEQNLKVQLLGGGTHSGYGSPERPDVVMSMDGLGQVERWEPDDLTIVSGAGARIGDIESMLAEKNQTAVLPEVPGGSTLGGAIAAGVSSLRRGRLFATRERVLEATVVTGDGRVVRSGGRVVKNVTGYDLHRLHVGAFGSLGVLVSLCLKLWPTPPAAATVTVGDLEQARAAIRPLAVLEDNDSIRVFIWGTNAEVEAKAMHLGGDMEEGHSWPNDPTGKFKWSLRVPPAMTSEALRRIPDRWGYLAVHGVGELRLGSETADGATELRSWAETVQGHLVNTGRPPGFDDLDPWGAPPPSLELQKKLIHQFDPKRIINPGRLPGGL